MRVVCARATGTSDTSTTPAAHVKPAVSCNSAQAAGRGLKEERNSADLAEAGESVVRDFCRRPMRVLIDLELYARKAVRLFGFAGALC